MGGSAAPSGPGQGVLGEAGRYLEAGCRYYPDTLRDGAQRSVGVGPSEQRERPENEVLVSDVKERTRGLGSLGCLLALGVWRL